MQAKGALECGGRRHTIVLNRTVKAGPRLRFQQGEVRVEASWWERALTFLELG